MWMKFAKARIHPARPACDLTNHEVSCPHAAIIGDFGGGCAGGGLPSGPIAPLGAAGTYQESLATMAEQMDL